MTRRPTVSPPRLPLRWYIAMARLVLARLVERIDQAGLSKALRLVAIGLAFAIAAQVPGAREATAQGVPLAQAWATIVWQVVIMVAAALISYAMRPKPKDPAIAKSQAPVVEDGKGIVIISGTVWIDDPIILAWKDKGTSKIKADGGKKG